MHLLRVLSWRYWQHHFGTLLLTILGVTLGAAVFVAIQVANHSVLASFKDSLDATSGRANLQINGGTNGLPDSLFLKVKMQQWQNPRIEATLPVLADSLYSPTLKNTLYVQGIDFFSALDFIRPEDENNISSASPNQFSLTKSTFALLTEPNTIAISSDVAKRANLKIGNIIKFIVGADIVSMHVAEILNTNQAKRAYGGDFAVVDIATAQEILQEKGKLSRIDLMVEEDAIPSIISELQKIVPPDAVVQRPAQRSQQIAGMLAAFQLNLTALSCVALFVGLFLVNNAIASAVVRRRHEVAILRTIGASRGQLMTLFQSEAAVMGFVGSCLGLLLGIWLAHLALSAVSKTVSSLYVEVHARQLKIPLWLYFAVPLGGTLMAWGASWFFAREANSVSPRMAFSNSSLHQNTQNNSLPFAGIGILLLCVGGLLCRPRISHISPLIGFVAAFFTLSGFAFLCPLMTLFCSLTAQKISGLFGNPAPRLASMNLRLTLHRTSLVVAALAVALSLVVGLEVMVYSFRHSVAVWVDQSLTGDLYISTARGFSGDPGPGLPPEVLRKIQQQPGIEALDTLRGSHIHLQNQPVFIAARSLDAVFVGRSKVPFKSTFKGTQTALQNYRDGKVLFISERFSNLLKKNAGETLQLPTPQGEKYFFIAAVFYDYTPDAAVLYMPQSLYKKYWPPQNPRAVALFLKNPKQTNAFKDRLQKYFSSRYQLDFVSHRELRKSVFKTFDDTFAVTYALEAIALIVAALGTLQTMLALVLERDLEIAILRTIGASKKQVSLLLFVELTLLALVAWIMAIATGLMLAWQLIYVINQQFFGWTIFWSFPWSLPPRTLILMLIVSWIAGILPWRVLTKRQLADALASE